MTKYNLNKISTNKGYFISDITALYGVSRKTCEHWIKFEGLKVVDENKRPFLIMGEELRKFIKHKKNKAKKKLKEEEFFCMKCHDAVKAKNGSVQVVKTGKLIGRNNNIQLKKVGFCERCNTKLNRILR